MYARSYTSRTHMSFCQMQALSLFRVRLLKTLNLELLHALCKRISSMQSWTFTNPWDYQHYFPNLNCEDPTTNQHCTRAKP